MMATQVARLDPTAVQRRTFKVRRLERLIGELASIIGVTMDELAREIRKQVAGIGVHQAEFAASTLQRAVGPTVTIGHRAGLNLFKAVLDDDPIQGRFLKDWFVDLGEATRRNVTKRQPGPAIPQRRDS